MNTRKYTHKVINATGGLCSEHYSREAAEKAVRRYVKMSNGKVTASAWTILEI